ncbi:cholinesterase 1-like [Galendromus occidentalis]|uniref:Carboxylic ester hydrolase n=1 Tax=Galendromus occidentalis TaxID=34638 RepID=A0AAJ7P9W7_9ACAR|nr:cholinesterase 1-like [Galendromus occidentalis]
MFTTETFNFSEDCLFLNLWRPKGTTAKDSKAVVVVFHGGGYVAGDGSEHDWRGGSLSALGDVIVINFNYRLGVFGFLDLGIEEAPGHQGHWDQLLVLEWVRDNVRNFGGDPERVLLIGVSAGSFSISAHLMSPHSRGLFHAAVLDAGIVALGDTIEDSAERATKIANSVSCSNSTVEEIVECLKNLDASLLLELQQEFAVSQTYVFRPTQSNEFIGDGSLEELLATAAENFNHVPIIIGDSAKEGAFLMTERVNEPLPELATLEQTLGLMRNICEWHFVPEFPVDSIMSAYELSDDMDTFAYRNATADFIGDSLFVCPVTKFAAVYSKYSMVYHYFWERKTVSSTVGADPWAFGAYHGIPFYHMLGSFFESFDDLAPEDVSYSMAAIEMLVEFAKTAKQPSFRGVSLPAFDALNKKVFIFDDSPHTVSGHPRQNFCDTLFSAESRSTVKTSDEL